MAANPPKTTEWIAPILAQASIAIAALGTIGIYINTLSPFWILNLDFRIVAYFATSDYNCLYVYLVYSPVYALS